MVSPVTLSGLFVLLFAFPRPVSKFRNFLSSICILCYCFPTTPFARFLLTWKSLWTTLFQRVTRRKLTGAKSESKRSREIAKSLETSRITSTWESYGISLSSLRACQDISLFWILLLMTWLMCTLINHSNILIKSLVSTGWLWNSRIFSIVKKYAFGDHPYWRLHDRSRDRSIYGGRSRSYSSNQILFFNHQYVDTKHIEHAY